MQLHRQQDTTKRSRSNGNLANKHQGSNKTSHKEKTQLEHKKKKLKKN